MHHLYYQEIYFRLIIRRLKYTELFTLHSLNISTIVFMYIKHLLQKVFKTVACTIHQLVKNLVKYQRYNNKQ